MKKILGILILAVLVIWGATQVNWQDVLGSKTDKAAVHPPAAASESPTAEPSESPSASGAASDDVKEPEASSSESADSGEGKPSADKPDSALDALLALNAPAQTVSANADGIAVVTNADSLLVLVDKKRNLPSDYIPADLVVPDVKFSFSGENEKKYMRKEAADALEKLFAGAKEDGIELAAVSGYRSYKRQKQIFDANAAAKGAEVANQTSAVPGQSEHQTGLAMDVSSASAKYELETTFGDTKEGKWLAKHADEYGFIIRYPNGMQDITGYTYEPWHVRYVGKDVAKAVYDSGLTLEAFMEQYDDATKA